MVQLIRIGANIISLFGIFYLVRIIVFAINGKLVDKVFPEIDINTENIVLALILSLPVAFHIISIGLILQKRWLPVLVQTIMRNGFLTLLEEFCDPIRIN